MEEAKDRARRALYDAGMSDGEIADREGVSAQSVSKWRGVRELPPNHPRWHLSEEGSAARRARYDAGMTGAQIAAEEGVTSGAIAQWRGVLGLEPNDGHGRHRRRHLPSDVEAERVALIEAGVPVAEIARRQGVTAAAVYAWRASRRAPAAPSETGWLSEEERARRLALVAEGLSTSEIARRCGVTRQAISQWRKTLQAKGD